MNVLNAMKEIVEVVNETSEDTATAENLLNLKKELAEQIVEKMEAESPDLLLSMGRDFVVDYLVDEGMMDKIHDAFVEKGLDALTSVSPKLKELREQLKEIESKEALEKLKNEILGNQAPAESPSVPVTENANPSSPDEGASSSSVSPTPEASQSSSQGSPSVGAGLNVLPNESNTFPYESLKGTEKPDKIPFEFAMQGYEKLKGRLGNPQYLTVVDYSKSNKENRFFVINMQTKSVEYAVPVGHGKKSGGEFANSFSDKMGSNQSSLGFYRTPEHITKANTKSRSGLLLRGMEESNDNATDRGIYIHPGGVNGSEGCFTLPEKSSEIMNKLKGDSLLFAYYPDNQYLASSEVLSNDRDEYYA